MQYRSIYKTANTLIRTRSNAIMSGPCSSSAAVLQTAQAPTLIKRTSSKREHEHNDTEETSPASKSKPKQAKLAPIFGSSSDSKGKGKAAGTVDASAVLGERVSSSYMRLVGVSDRI